MKNLIFIIYILIVLFQTGNVLSNSSIFNVNNVEIGKETYKNKENLVNQAFIKSYDQLISRLLLEEDYKILSNTNLKEIKKLISYYQIINPEIEKKEDNIRVNVFFDKDRLHNFFYKKNILYSDIVNTEVIFFPLLKKNNQHFIYTKNYFYENWNLKNSNRLIQYNLPFENIENIEKIKLNKDNIFNLDVKDFFKEYDIENLVFANIEISNNNAKIFLNTKISGKKINKTLMIKGEGLIDKDFYNKIIFEIKNTIKDLIKSQNLIDVRTPSFLNVEIKLTDKNNLVEFNKRLENIDLIDKFSIRQLNKDFALAKIKYLGKINKIINKLKDQNINLKMKKGQWQLKII
jgi:hypothetical protein